MKEFAAIAFCLMLALFASGCVQHTCEPPYTVRGSGCCLDENGNKICDAEETPAQNQTPNYGAYEVKMYLSQFSPEPDSWHSLPSSPVRHNDGYQIFNYQQNESYYDAGWFILYTNYQEEPVRCLLEEHHDSVLYSQQNLTLTKRGYSGNVSGVSLKALFLKTSTPREARYTIDCRGAESGITFQDAYMALLRI